MCLLMSTTIEVVCYKYKPLKDNTLPLKIRITKDRKRRYVNLGISVLSSHWDFVKNQPKSNCPHKEEIEKIVTDKIQEFRDKILEFKVEKREFTATSLKERTSSQTKVVTVGELFKQIIGELRDSGRIGYAASIEQVYRSLLQFNRHLDIYFSEIDVSWLKRYELWLRKRGKAENTIGIRFRTLRMAYNRAIDLNCVKTDIYPFRKFKVGKLRENTQKRAISKEDVRRIMEFPCGGQSFYKQLAVDLFSFSYLVGGINFVDMANLTEKNVVDGRLVYKRQKTGKFLNLPICSCAMDILAKYAPGRSYLFPIYSDQHKTAQQKMNRYHKVIVKINRELSEIGEELQLPVKLTTYVARHTYATVLKRSGIPESIISESLGHSSERVTRIYLDSFENEQIDKALKNLL